MAWLKIEGHDEIVAQFRRALEENRLASTFLFVGPEGIGKRAFAVRLAQSLLCEKRDEKLLDPCGQCPACAQVLAGTHPDLIQISRPEGKSDIPVGILKGDDKKPEYPVEQSLLFNLALRPFYGGRKVAIVDDADDLNPEGANCLLKTLEEPPPRSMLILISTSVDRQLPTIRSRAQIVRFKPLEPAIVARLLIEQGTVTDPEDARRLAAQSGGSVSRAAEMADPQLWQFRRELLNQLSHFAAAEHRACACGDQVRRRSGQGSIGTARSFAIGDRIHRRFLSAPGSADRRRVGRCRWGISRGPGARSGRRRMGC